MINRSISLIVFPLFSLFTLAQPALGATGLCANKAYNVAAEVFDRQVGNARHFQGMEVVPTPENEVKYDVTFGNDEDGPSTITVLMNLRCDVIQTPQVTR